MKEWILLFSGPVTGFVIGLLTLYLIFKKIPTVRHLLLSEATSLTEALPLLQHNETHTTRAAELENVPLLQQIVSSTSSTTMRNHDVDIERGVTQAAARPTILYYADAVSAPAPSAAHPSIFTQTTEEAAAMQVLRRSPTSGTALLTMPETLSPQTPPMDPFTPPATNLAMPRMPATLFTPPSHPGLQGTISIHNAQQVGLLPSLYAAGTNAMTASLQQQLPSILEVNRLPWMSSVHLLTSIEQWHQHSCRIKKCSAAANSHVTQGSGCCLVLDVSWSTQSELQLQLDLGSVQPPVPIGKASLLVVIHSIQIEGVISVTVEPHPHGIKSSFHQPPRASMEVSCVSSDVSRGSHQAVEAASVIKAWLKEKIISHVLGTQVDSESNTPQHQSMGNGSSGSDSATALESVQDVQDPLLGSSNHASYTSITAPRRDEGFRNVDPHVPPAPEVSTSNTESLQSRMSEGLSSSTASVGRRGRHPRFSVEPEEPAVKLDLAAVRLLATMKPSVWEGIHVPGKACPFSIRGKNYLKDRVKIPAGMSAFTLSAFDMVALPRAVEHVARFLPSVRRSGANFAFVINLIIPGTPLLSLVATFVTDRDCFGLASISPPEDPMDTSHGWTPFDFVLHRFMTGDVTTRNKMLKLIPHIDSGNWVVKQAVGTKPVIIGKALKTTYHVTKQYMEIDIDVSANSTASYITGMVRGATSGLVIDLGFVLEGQLPWELPEVLIGASRVSHLDVRDAQVLDISKEIPLAPPATKPAPSI